MGREKAKPWSDEDAQRLVDIIETATSDGHKLKSSRLGWSGFTDRLNSEFNRDYAPLGWFSRYRMEINKIEKAKQTPSKTAKKPASRAQEMWARRVVETVEGLRFRGYPLRLYGYKGDGIEAWKSLTPILNEKFRRTCSAKTWNSTYLFCIEITTEQAAEKANPPKQAKPPTPAKEPKRFDGDLILRLAEAKMSHLIACILREDTVTGLAVEEIRERGHSTLADSLEKNHTIEQYARELLDA